MTRVLHIDAAGWRVARVTDEAVTWLGVTNAAQVRDEVGDEPVAIVLASSWCLCATVANPPTQRRWRQAMQFELEEHLPVTAEDLVADYVVGARESFAVAARVSRLGPIVTALSEAAVEVAAIHPATLVALRHGAVEADGADLVILSGEREADLLLLDEGRLVGWHVVRNDPLKIAARLEQLPTERRPMRMVAYGLADADARALAERLNVELLRARVAMVDAAALAASVLSGGEWRDGVDLLRPPLHESRAARSGAGALRTFAAALTLCLVAWIAALLWAGYRYEQSAATMLDEQRRVMSETLPGATRTNTQVVRRLESELQRLSNGATTGPVVDDRPTFGTSAFGLMRDVFEALPDAALDGAAYRLTRMHVTGDTFRLDGVADTHKDAGLVAQRLSERGDLQIDPPQTTVSRNEGVRFTITGARRHGSSSTGVSLSKAGEP